MKQYSQLYSWVLLILGIVASGATIWAAIIILVRRKEYKQGYREFLLKKKRIEKELEHDRKSMNT
jgi:hypothetical protein